MKLELNFNWTWILHKVRLAFLVGVFYAIYTYVHPVFALMWGMYFILNDLQEIVHDVEEMKEERSQAWKNISTKRKDF
jgi:hypothetical protein